MDKSGLRFVVHFPLIEQPRNSGRKNQPKRRRTTIQTCPVRGVRPRRLTTGRVPVREGINTLAYSTTGKFTKWRYVTGAFQVTIPVTTEEAILPSDENTLAIMKWRLDNM